jgi:hypothetical protein
VTWSAMLPDRAGQVFPAGYYQVVRFERLGANPAPKEARGGENGGGDECRLAGRGDPDLGLTLHAGVVHRGLQLL